MTALTLIPSGVVIEPRTNTAGGSYDVEASTAGLAPGEWPVTIHGNLAARGLEPIVPIALVRDVVERDREGEVVAVHYATTLGTYTLTVWND